MFQGSETLDWKVRWKTTPKLLGLQNYAGFSLFPCMKYRIIVRCIAVVILCAFQRWPCLPAQLLRMSNLDICKTVLFLQTMRSMSTRAESQYGRNMTFYQDAIICQYYFFQGSSSGPFWGWNSRCKLRATVPDMALSQNSWKPIEGLYRPDPRR